MSRDKFAGVHPELQAKVVAILEAMRVLGYTMIVIDGLRTAEQQAILYAKGRTAPGPIVTWCDGVRDKSNHQPHDDGFGHAVDCCFLIHGLPAWDLALPWKLYGEMGKAIGLRWGGDFSRLIDKPHLELPDPWPPAQAPFKKA